MVVAYKLCIFVEKAAMEKGRADELLIIILEHIERNLHKPISLDEIADSACLSKYHLHRLMKDFLGQPLISYITRIRLERALMYLRTSSKSVAEVANEVGYQSVNSFIKAFKKRFGVAPKSFLTDSELKNAEIKGHLTIPETATYVSSIYALYVPVIGRYGGDNFDLAWSDLLKYAREKNLLTEKTRYLGIYFDDPSVTDEKYCRTYLCVTVDRNIKSEKPYISTLKIDAGFYFVYTFRGEYSELSNVYKYIFNTETPLVHQYRTHFEEYLEYDDKELPTTRIFIPIVKTAR